MTKFFPFLKDEIFSSVKAIESILKNINASQEHCNVFISISKDLEKQALESDERRRKGQRLSPIDGVPVSLKDNICTNWLPTTCASQILRNFYSPFNASVVERILSLGGIIVGKTNMDEFGMGSHNLNTSFGKCVDFRKLNSKGFGKSFGGSSGGSAASISLGCSALSIGTDTGGSIRFPAHNSNLIGFKPSRGAISRHGIIPFSNYLDSVGILGRAIEEVETLFWLLAGKCPKDSTTVAIERKEANENFIPKIAILCLQEHQDRELLCEIFKMENFDFLSFPSEFNCDSLQKTYITISNCEAFSNLARFDPFNSFSSTIKHTVKSYLFEEERKKLLGIEVQKRISNGKEILKNNRNELMEAYKKAQSLKQVLEDSFCKYNLILSITCSYGAEFVDEIQADSFDSTIKWTVPFSLSGHPTISIPISILSPGHKSELSIQITAPFGKDYMIFDFLNQCQNFINKHLFK